MNGGFQLVGYATCPFTAKAKSILNKLNLEYTFTEIERGGWMSSGNPDTICWKNATQCFGLDNEKTSAIFILDNQFIVNSFIPMPLTYFRRDELTNVGKEKVNMTVLYNKTRYESLEKLYKKYPMLERRSEKWPNIFFNFRPIPDTDHIISPKQLLTKSGLNEMAALNLATLPLVIHNGYIVGGSSDLDTYLCRFKRPGTKSRDPKK
jgi:hypothetical protein